MNYCFFTAKHIGLWVYLYSKDKGFMVRHKKGDTV